MIEALLAAPPSEAESGLIVLWNDIRKAIGRYLGFNTDPYTWSDANIDTVQYCIDSGYREWLGENWSFLKPFGTLTTEYDASISIAYDSAVLGATTVTVGIADGVLTLTRTGGPFPATNTFTLANYDIQGLVAAINDSIAMGTAAYDAIILSGHYEDADQLSDVSTVTVLDTTVTLPGTFKQDYTLPAVYAGMRDKWVYFAESGDGAYFKIPLVSPGYIVERRSYSEQNGRPTHAAVRSVTPNTSIGQRFELMLYPRPDDAYELTYPFYYNVESLNDQNVVPPGGMQFGESLKQTCIAFAEQNIREEGNGPQAARAAFLLEKALANDARLGDPKSLGIVRDRSDGPDFFDRRGCRGQAIEEFTVTYRGL